MTIISALPYTLVNGTTADASQVQADLAQIVSNVNANAASAGANSNITSLSGLATPLSIGQGGTGNTSGLATSTNALASATTTVNVSSATAPTTGQVLTATGGSAATWQTNFAGTATTATNLLGGTVQSTQLGFETGIGVGGVVTQTSAITNPVSLSTMTGQITTINYTYGSGSNQQFKFNNSNIGANDIVAVSLAYTGSVSSNFTVASTNVQAGSCYIQLNPSFSGAFTAIINFAIIKGSIN